MSTEIKQCDNKPIIVNKTTNDNKPTTDNKPKATVVNIKVENLRRRNFDSILEWKQKSDKNVYIGRDMTCWIPGTEKSKFHNPYNVKQYGAKVIPLYLEYLEQNPKLLQAARDELQGCELGCWCKPEMCHGDMLAEIANNTELTPLECVAQVKLKLACVSQAKLESVNHTSQLEAS